MRSIETHDATIATLDEGSGPPVVLLHGFPFDHSMWEHQIEALKGQYRVIAPDLRGFGKSTIEPISAKTGVSMADYADDVAEVLDAVGVDEPVALCGFSMGGYIAWQFYQRHRSKLRALVMCNTKAAGDAPQTRETRYKMAENVEGWGSAHVARLMMPKLFTATTVSRNRKTVERLDALISKTNHVAIAAAQRGMAHRDDSTSLLSQIDLPVLFVAGADDEISQPDEMKAMADATPDARYVVVPEAGHMTPVENPAAVTKAIEGFLAELN